MTQDIVTSVKVQLNNRFYFMNDEWLRQCVEYFLGEGYTGEFDLMEIVDFVISEYLLADLRLINTRKSTLPENLAEIKQIILPGSYMLQVHKLESLSPTEYMFSIFILDSSALSKVNEMYDILKPKYKQLQLIRKASTLHSQVMEEDEKRETSGHTIEVTKRMMYLKMTDGMQDILGMEYTHVSFLNEIFNPGCKVLIRGPVKCRNGVLYLEEGNIEGKGGKVGSLLIPNAMENLLARAVNKAENPDPFHVGIAVKNGRPKSSKATKARVRVSEEQVVMQVQNAYVDALLSDEDFDINMDEIVNIEMSHSQNDKNVDVEMTEQSVEHSRGSSDTDAPPSTATTSAKSPSEAQTDKTNEARENAEKSMKEECETSMATVNNVKEEELNLQLSRECFRYGKPEIPSDGDCSPLKTIKPGEEEDDDMDGVLEAELEDIEKRRLGKDERTDERVWSPYVTEPGGKDDDVLHVSDEMGFSNLSVKDSGHSSNGEDQSAK